MSLDEFRNSKAQSETRGYFCELLIGYWDMARTSRFYKGIVFLALVVVTVWFCVTFGIFMGSDEKPIPEAVGSVAFVTILTYEEDIKYIRAWLSAIESSQQYQFDAFVMVPFEVNSEQRDSLESTKAKLVHVADIEHLISELKWPLTLSDMYKSCQMYERKEDSLICPYWRVLPFLLQNHDILIYVDYNILILEDISQVTQTGSSIIQDEKKSGRPSSFFVWYTSERSGAEILKLVTKLHSNAKEVWNERGKSYAYRKTAFAKLLHTFLVDALDSSQIESSIKVWFPIKNPKGAMLDHPLVLMLDEVTYLQSWGNLYDDKCLLCGPFFEGDEFFVPKLWSVWANMHSNDPNIRRRLLQSQKEEDCAVEKRIDSTPGFTAVVFIDEVEKYELNSLTKVLDTLAELPICAKIILAWNSIHTNPPSITLLSRQSPNLRDKLTISRQQIESANNRFRPHNIPTEHVFLMNDKDVFSAYDLTYFYHAARQLPTTLLGIEALLHSNTSATKFKVEPPTNRHYSLITSPFMVLHRNYLHDYTCSMYSPLFDFADTDATCASLAMNFLVASYQSAAPLIVQNSNKKYRSRKYTVSESEAKKMSQCLENLSFFYNGTLPRYTTDNMVGDYHINSVDGYIMHEDGSVDKIPPLWIRILLNSQFQASAVLFAAYIYLRKSRQANIWTPRNGHD